MNLFPVPAKKEKIKILGVGPDMVFPYGFFDGSAIDSQGGAGVNIAISSTLSLSFKLGCGPSTNTRAKLLAFWTLLLVAQKLGLPYLHIYGDSSVIINWANNRASLSSIELTHWCDNIRTLMDGFVWLDICHIYWEHNQSADGLSKDSLVLTPGILSFFEIMDGSICENGEYQLF